MRQWLTGPQSMPVFNDANITPENKRDIIAYLHDVDKQREPRRPEAGQPGPGLRGTVRLDLRHRPPHRLRRLARQEGRVTMTRPPRPPARDCTTAKRQDPHTMTDNGNSSSRAATPPAPATTAVALSRSTRATSKAPAASRSTSPTRVCPRTCTARPTSARRPPRRRSGRSRRCSSSRSWPRCCSSWPTSRSRRTTAPTCPHRHRLDLQPRPRPHPRAQPVLHRHRRRALGQDADARRGGRRASGTPQRSPTTPRQAAVDGVYAGGDAGPARPSPADQVHPRSARSACSPLPLVLQMAGGLGPLPDAELSQTMWRKGRAAHA